MRRLRKFFKSWGEERRRQRRAARPFRVASAIGLAALAATYFLYDKADPDALNAGLTTLITVNAVVVGLTYATTQTAVSLTARTDESASYSYGVNSMAKDSLAGVLLGIVHLVWSPGGRLLVPFAAYCLVSAPAMLPMLAAQERRAQRARSEEGCTTS